MKPNISKLARVLHADVKQLKKLNVEYLFLYKKSSTSTNIVL